MRFVMLCVVLGLAAGCYEDSCEEYIQYMCDCHPDEDCADLRNQYQNADAATQDDCALELDSQQESDDEDGLTCELDTGVEA